MRRIVFCAVLIAFLITFSPASAATLTFYSHGSAANTPISSWSSSVGPLLEITPNSAWHNLPLSGPPKWISPWNSGAQVPGYFSPSNGTMLPFTLDFVIPTNFVVSSAALSVLADDTTDGFLNGNQIFAHGSGQALHCVVTPPGCVAATVWSGSVNTSWFSAGANEITFNPKQIYGYSYGMQMSLEVVGDYREQVPEPSTLALMTIGAFLVGLSWIKKKV